MSFVDKVEVLVKAGDGGNGHLSFRHEKFIDKGGPDGGDGGNGGSVVLVASRNQDTLANFRYQKQLKAEPGQPGGKQKKHGKMGSDLLVLVPVGTMAISKDGLVVADLIKDGQQVIVAKGGRGGFGNAHFVSSTRQAPRIAEKGEPGEEFSLVFELKMIADVGLVGLPNAGKSTLLSVLSNAKPQIADYPFTTLTPNLGVVDLGKNDSLLVADIPGLIEGAAEGKGLGDEFLRHVERTAVIIHLIDAYNEDIASAYRTIQAELAAYKLELSSRPQIVVLTKTEGFRAKQLEKLLDQLVAIVPVGTQVLTISSQAHEGLDVLLAAVTKIVKAERAKQARRAAAKESELPILRLPENADSWHVEKQDDNFIVHGIKIEHFATRTDFNSPQAIQRLRDIMSKMGILHELDRQGAKPGNTIIIGLLHQIKY